MLFLNSLALFSALALPLALMALVLLHFAFPGRFGSLVYAHGDHGPREAAPAFGLSEVEPLEVSSEAQPTSITRVETAQGVFHMVSLRPLANAVMEPSDEWQTRVWKSPMRQLPRGQQAFAGVPFYVIPKVENGGKAVVTLEGGRYQLGPRGGGSLAIGRKAQALYVLHTASYQNLNTGRAMATYIVHYGDGSLWEIPIRNKIELADFMDNQNMTDDCVVAWTTSHPFFTTTFYCVYALRLVNPYPNKEIASIEFKPAAGAAVASVLGITLGEGAPTLAKLADIKPFARPNEAKAPKGRLALRIEVNGKPVAARVFVRASNGKTYQPYDGINHFMLGRSNPFFYADGTVDIDVPAGDVRIGVAKGFEYKPVDVTVSVAEGQTVEQTVQLERWIDMPAHGWYAGEMHIHPFDQEPEDTAICMLAEDLHIGNLLIWGNGFSKRYYGDQFFRGEPEPWPDAAHIAYYNEEFRNNTYGHLCLIDLRELVYPMGTGSEYGIEDYPANAVIMDRTHEQNGFASVAHMSIAPVNYAVPWEVSIDVALGKADSVDIDLRNFDRSQDRSLDLWYRLLNCGYRIPATCGTDSFMNQSWTNHPLGNLRTYGYLGKEFSYARWVEAARRGRSFVTKGPAIFLNIEGKYPSDILKLGQGANPLRVQAETHWQYPLKKLEIIRNGEVVSSVAGGAASTTLKIDQTIETEGGRSAWFAARAEGQTSEFFLHPALYAHTNPIYCEGANPLRSPEDAQFFVNEINGLIDWVRTKGDFSNPAHREEVKALFEKARGFYEAQTVTRAENW